MLRVLILITSVFAYQQDLSKVPNGNTYGITLGHPGGATKKATPFANSFYSSGQKWTKAFCQADTDGDGQSNGLEMGDPCCVWSLGKTAMVTTSLSDPNSVMSKTTRQMPNCVQANALPLEMLQCSVCTQALQLNLNKPSDNAVDFSLLSVKSCKDATQVDQQQIICVKTMLNNANQLFKDQKNGVSPIQSCMNLVLTCMPTQAPLPTTQAPLPTTQAPLPSPPLPPVVQPFDSKLPGPGVCSCGKARYDVASCDSDECYKACDLRNTGHGVCVTKKVAEMIATQVETQVEPSKPDSESDMTIIIVLSSVLLLMIVGGIARLYTSSKKEPVIDLLEQPLSDLPEVDYKVLGE